MARKGVLGDRNGWKLRGKEDAWEALSCRRFTLAGVGVIRANQARDTGGRADWKSRGKGVSPGADQELCSKDGWGVEGIVMSLFHGLGGHGDRGQSRLQLGE